MKLPVRFVNRLINPFAPTAGYIRHVRCDVIKSFVLCDCKTGYISDFVINTEAGTPIEAQHEDCGKSGNIVTSLLEPYLGKGHALYVGNWYTSPALFDILHKNFTNASGIIKQRRKGIPEMNEKLQKGEPCFRMSGNILAIKRHYKKEIFIISIIHTEEFVDVPKHYSAQEIFQKLSCVHDYNELMGAIDMVISTINSRKTTKWYKKYFFHMIDMCL